MSNVVRFPIEALASRPALPCAPATPARCIPLRERDDAIGTDPARLPSDPRDSATFRALTRMYVERHGEIPGWLSYDLPADLVGIALKGKYRGQRQRWFAMRFTGNDSEIDIRPRRGLKAEFDAWRWESIDNVPKLIVPFKRDIYEEVVKGFRQFARPAR